jgi:hypothetical protein
VAQAVPLSMYTSEMQKSVEAFRATPAGQHALRMYAEERLPGQPRGARVVLKSKGRDRVLAIFLVVGLGVGAVVAGVYAVRHRKK